MNIAKLKVFSNENMCESFGMFLRGEHYSLDENGKPHPLLTRNSPVNSLKNLLEDKRNSPNQFTYAIHERAVYNALAKSMVDDQSVTNSRTVSKRQK